VTVTVRAPFLLTSERVTMSARPEGSTDESPGRSEAKAWVAIAAKVGGLKARDRPLLQAHI
jgi:hypothetical protein